MKKRIEAKIVADSISENGNRITTMLLTYPRFIHTEVMTHRAFSRNSASSRAIPFKKMVKMVEEDPFVPIAWQKEHKGMQGNEYIDIFSNPTCYPPGDWLEARDAMIEITKEMNEDGVTKQLCNRLLEPFMWHTALVTSTEWDNFFELRCPQYEYKGEVFKSKKECIRSYSSGLGKGFEEDRKYLNYLTDLEWLQINKSQAEIHIQALAESMWDVMNENAPKQLEIGERHIPFQISGEEASRNALTETARVKIAVARCARLSYLNHEEDVNYEKDIELHDRLLKMNHMSPFEHIAECKNDDNFYANFKGWQSYRNSLNK